MSASGGGAHDADGDQGQRPAGGALDHAEPAAGQARVDAEHPHRRTSRRPNTCSGETYRRPGPQPAHRRARRFAALSTGVDNARIVNVG